MKHLQLTIILLLSSVAQASTDQIDSLNWILKKHTDDIQIYSAKVPNSPHHAILAETQIDADTETLVGIIRSPESCSKWVYRCRLSFLHDQISPNTDLIYTATNMPFPAANRDILAKVTWHTDASTNITYGIGTATTDIVPSNNKDIRIENAEMIWALIPLENGSTKVRSYAHVDPAGGLPAWLTNQLSVNVPLKTLKGLKKISRKTSNH